jgi:hypothetical protein
MSVPDCVASWPMIRGKLHSLSSNASGKFKSFGC